MLTDCAFNIKNPDDTESDMSQQGLEHPVIFKKVNVDDGGDKTVLNLYQNSTVRASVSLLYSENDGRVNKEF